MNNSNQAISIKSWCFWKFVIDVFFSTHTHHITSFHCSIQEDLLHLVPLHHPHTLPVVKMKRDHQKDQNPGLSGQRRKRSTSQKARILEPIVKMVADQFAYRNFLGHQELIVVEYLVLYHKIVFLQIVNYGQLYFYDQHFLYKFVILCHILCSLSRSLLTLGWLM